MSTRFYYGQQDYITQLNTMDDVVSTAGAGASFGANAGENLNANDLVYIASNGTIMRANALTEGKEAVGFVAQSYGVGTFATMKMAGNTMLGLIGLTPGAVYYMATTAGQLVSVAVASNYSAGNVLLQIGNALSSSMLVFRPNIPITL